MMILIMFYTKPLASVPERRAQIAEDSIESVVSIERLFEKHSFSTTSSRLSETAFFMS